MHSVSKAETIEPVCFQYQVTWFPNKYFSKKMFKSIVVLWMFSMNISLSLALHKKCGNGSLTGNSYWNNLIGQLLSKHSTNELNMLIVDISPYSMYNENTGLLEGFDVLVIQAISAKLNINVSVTLTKDLDQVRREDLE